MYDHRSTSIVSGGIRAACNNLVDARCVHFSNRCLSSSQFVDVIGCPFLAALLTERKQLIHP